MTERSAGGWLKGRFLGERFGRLRLPERQGSEAAEARKVRTAVVTDSASALPVEWSETAERHDWFAVVPLSVMAGDDIFSDGTEAEAALGIALAAGQQVKTSRPAPGVFERVYKRLKADGYEAIVSIHLSGALSGTVDAARLAADRVDLPIQVIDTRLAGLAEGFAVQAAANAAAGGADADTVAEAARSALEGAQVRFFLPSLEQLRRGGRIGAAASWVGTVLSIKLLLALRDGQIVPIERIRTSARALPRLRELSLEDARKRSKPRLAVHYFGNKPEAEELAGELAAALGDDTHVVVSPLPAVLAAHTGLGVLAIVVSGREDRAAAPPRTQS